MAKIKSINGVSLHGPLLDLSEGFPSYFRGWIEENNINKPTDLDVRKSLQEYAQLDVSSLRGWCGIEASIQRTKRAVSDDEIRKNMSTLIRAARPRSSSKHEE